MATYLAPGNDHLPQPCYIPNDGQCEVVIWSYEVARDAGQAMNSEKNSAAMKSFYKRHKGNGTNPALSEILHMLESAI